MEFIRSSFFALIGVVVAISIWAIDQISGQYLTNLVFSKLQPHGQAMLLNILVGFSLSVCFFKIGKEWDSSKRPIVKIRDFMRRKIHQGNEIKKLIEKNGKPETIVKEEGGAFGDKVNEIFRLKTCYYNWLNTVETPITALTKEDAIRSFRDIASRKITRTNFDEHLSIDIETLENMVKNLKTIELNISADFSILKEYEEYECLR